MKGRRPEHQLIAHGNTYTRLSSSSGYYVLTGPGRTCCHAEVIAFRRDPAYRIFRVEYIDHRPVDEPTSLQSTECRFHGQCYFISLLSSEDTSLDALSVWDQLMFLYRKAHCLTAHQIAAFEVWRSHAPAPSLFKGKVDL